MVKYQAPVVKPLVDVNGQFRGDLLDVEIILRARLQKGQIIVAGPFLRLLLRHLAAAL